MCKHLSGLGAEVESSELNCRKIEVFKTEIKEKLREFASNIDEVYKILDRKIIIILNELKKFDGKEDKNQNVCSKCSNRNNSKVNL